jgi:hypothetical protein
MTSRPQPGWLIPGYLPRTAGSPCPITTGLFGTGRAGPACGWSGEAGRVTAGGRPPHEIRRPGQVAGVPGQPLVKITLGARGQGQPPRVQPVQEHCRGGDLVTHVLHLLGRGRLAAEPAAQPAQVVPDGVSVQGTPCSGVLRPAMTWAVHRSRAVRRSSRAGSARRNQHRSQMNEGAARRQRVERLVSNHAAGCDGLQGAADGGLLQPVQHEVGTVDTGESLAQPVQLRRGGAAGRGEDLPQFPVQGTARALRGR